MASSLKFTNQNLDLLQKKETSTRNNQVSPKMIADNCTVAGKYTKSGGSCSRNYDNRRNSQRYDTEAGKVQNTARKFKLDFKDYSLMHWKKKFEVLKIEHIYQNYIVQIQRPLVIGYICLAIAILLGTSIYHIASTESFSNQEFKISQSVLTIGQVALVTCLVCVIKNSIYLKFSRWISSFIWILLLLISNLYFHVPARSQTTDDVAVIFFVIFMCHVMLPMSKTASLCFGGFSVIIQMTTSGIWSSKEDLIAELVSNFVILLSANMMGIGHKYLTDLHHRHTFLEARSMIQVKKKLEWENNQRDELLNCCIPSDMVTEMKGDITENMLNQSKKSNPELYVEKHYQEVSILYADIVNFTPLSAKCESPNELIDLLNKLFGRFDQLAEKHQCLRIKILGDCYVCVCGVPKANPNHALNCVSLGVDMIDAIREVRDESKTDVDMRIGVHSGKVLSGVIGLNKWQYDVWSDDVTLANNMEASGIPGKVHITKEVLDQLGSNHQFTVENGDGQKRNEYLREKNVETFVLSVKEQERPANRPKFSFRSYVKMAMFISKLQWKVEKPFAKWKAVSKAIRMSPGQLASSSSSRITSEIDIIQMGKKFHAEVNIELESKSSRLGKKGSWERNKDYNPWLMKFSKELESEYNKEPDLWFKVSLMLLFGVFVGIQIVHGVVSVRGIEYYTMFSVGFTVLTILIIISLGENFVSCKRTDQMAIECNKPIYFVLCSFLSLSANVLFLQIKYIVKILLMTVTLIVFEILFHTYTIFQTEGAVSLSVLGSVYTGVMFVALVFFCRQVEFMNRLDFLLKDQCRTEAKLSENSASLNMKLLENILPSHVAEYFLTDHAKDQELYSESHDNVCIMFASIPNFKDFYQESAARQCIELLNNIIGSFDQMLLFPEFSKVEKIKVIGSTYMAVTGLKPRENTNADSNHRLNVITMTKFALKMMSELENITTDTYQFKVRAGINTGPVTAGVIGAKRPLYDIWGDAVNVASRLDSSGEEGKIQITEKNAAILIDEGFNCQLRGSTLLKGKGEVITYMVMPS